LKLAKKAGACDRLLALLPPPPPLLLLRAVVDEEAEPAEAGVAGTGLAWGNATLGEGSTLLVLRLDNAGAEGRDIEDGAAVGHCWGSWDGNDWDS
jgi:hypothetical protein